MYLHFNYIPNLIYSIAVCCKNVLPCHNIITCHQSKSLTYIFCSFIHMSVPSCVSAVLKPSNIFNNYLSNLYGVGNLRFQNSYQKHFIQIILSYWRVGNLIWSHIRKEYFLLNVQISYIPKITVKISRRGNYDKFILMNH
jgi:hypothetical protein